MSKKREMSESGMLVYPQLPVPKQGRQSEPRMPTKGGGGKLGFVLITLALLAGAAAGFFVRPMVLDDATAVDAEAAVAKERIASAQAAAKLQDETKKLEEQRELLTKQLEAAKQAQEMLADKAADATNLKADLDAVKKKLDGTGAGTVAITGNEVRLTISTGTLFKAGDDLTPAGTKALDKVAAALKELADKQVAVHGHTDDQPPPRPAAPKAPKRDKKAGSRAIDKSPPPPPAAPAGFATNWELSSARALAVVHYLQDKHKIEASRLSALAFSQYKPVSKSNKAANRRIEIVLTQKPKK